MKKALVICLSIGCLTGVFYVSHHRISTAYRPYSSATFAYQKHLSHIHVEGTGTVARMLPDDTVGSRHQRFILRLPSEQTVLIVHNIDLAPRIEGLKRGDVVEFSGEYEWNAKGGIVHWTHHDPTGRHRGGWIRYRGRVYE